MKMKGDHSLKNFYLTGLAYIPSHCVLQAVFNLLDITFVSRSRGYKTFFMLSSAKNEILNAHKYKNIKKSSFFQAEISLVLFLMLINVNMPTINVKMPTIVGILTFMSRKNSCSVELSMEFFITSGPVLIMKFPRVSKNGIHKLHHLVLTLSLTVLPMCCYINSLFAPLFTTSLISNARNTLQKAMKICEGQLSDHILLLKNISFDGLYLCVNVAATRI